MADRITLDKKERLFLSNQLEILKNQQIIMSKINGLDGASLDVSYYDNQIKALREGYELHYGDPFEDIYDGLPYDECRFVLDVLEMYRGITYSYNALLKKNASSVVKHDDVVFRGFDLNTETEHFSYAKYFLIDLERYDEIKEMAGPYADFNSHTSLTLPKYKRQLEVWNNYRELDNRYQMTEEQLLKLINV